MKNIWVPVSGAIAQQRKVDTIANNVANAQTPGFKKDDLAFREHLVALEQLNTNLDLPRKEWAPEDFYRTQGAENALVEVDASFTNFEQGMLTPTNNPLDVAVHGKGFFEVLSPNGVRYTRKGNFTLNSEGLLVTSQGYPVLSEAAFSAEEGSEAATPQQRVIQLPGQGQISIDRQGTIHAGQGPLGQLAVTEFGDISALRKEGHALFINKNPNNVKQAPHSSSIHQGFVEESNVNVVKEMSELIKANRHFETIQKAIKTYDEMSGRSVNDIARF